MILSVSRRTDIPACYWDWFLNRVKEGYLYVKNPMNPHQVSKIEVSPETVDCMVFWTKNPGPMLEKMEEIKDYPFYVQFTLTGYGKEIEPGLPDKRRLISLFQELSRRIGKERVIWRYDPIFLNPSYSPAWHVNTFEETGRQLKDYTEKCVISFLDFYGKTERNIKGLNIRHMEREEMYFLAEKLKEKAENMGLVLETCGEELDFQSLGISHGSCIDKALIERILGCRLKGSKDRNQRPACGCMESVEVGTYDTCLNGCRYCYANENREAVQQRRRRYNISSPLLCGNLEQGDTVTVRKMKSLKEPQLRLVY